MLLNIFYRPHFTNPIPRVAPGSAFVITPGLELSANSGTLRMSLEKDRRAVE